MKVQYPSRYKAAIVLLVISLYLILSGYEPMALAIVLVALAVAISSYK